MKQQQWNYDDRAGVAVLVEVDDEGTTVEGSDRARLKRLENGKWRCDQRNRKGTWDIGIREYDTLEAGKRGAAKS